MFSFVLAICNYQEWLANMALTTQNSSTGWNDKIVAVEKTT